MDLSSQKIDYKDRPRQLLARTRRKLTLPHLVPVLTQPYLNTGAEGGASGWSVTARNSTPFSLISLLEAFCSAWITEIMLRRATCL